MTRITRVIVLVALIAACTDSPLPPPPSSNPAEPPPAPPPSPPPAPPPAPPPPAPPASVLLLSLTGPLNDDGALLFELKGPWLGAVTPADTTWAFSSEMISDSVLRVAIVASVSNRAILHVNLTNRTDVSAYRATILDVTNGSGQLRENLATYSIRIIAQ